MPEVFSFRVYDHASGDEVVQPRKSTIERIKRIGGTIIPDTGELVSESELDDGGRYTPNMRTTS